MFLTVFTAHKATFAISLSLFCSADVAHCIYWEIRIRGLTVGDLLTVFTAHKATFVISLSLLSSGR